MLATVSMLVDPRVPSAGVGLRAEAPDGVPASSERAPLSAESNARVRAMVDLHFEFIWRALRGLGVPSASVDDATQQVFWIAARKLDAIAVGSERAFLFGAARGIASNARRSQARNRERYDEGAIERQVDAGADPEQAAATREAARLLERILDDMPEEARTTFVLFELEGQTTSAIGELLGLPMGTVASRLRRAREIFQERAEALQRTMPRGGPTDE